MEIWSRRKFFLTSLAGSAVASANKLFGRDTDPGTSSAPFLPTPKTPLKASAR